MKKFRIKGIQTQKMNPDLINLTLSLPGFLAVSKPNLLAVFQDFQSRQSAKQNIHAQQKLEGCFNTKITESVSDNQKINFYI